MSEQYGVALIMPAYNEEEHLKDTISSIPEIVDLILFINDGSTDSTLEMAKNILSNLIEVILEIEFQN